MSSMSSICLDTDPHPTRDYQQWILYFRVKPIPCHENNSHTVDNQMSANFQHAVQRVVISVFRVGTDPDLLVKHGNLFSPTNKVREGIRDARASPHRRVEYDAIRRSRPLPSTAIRSRVSPPWRRAGGPTTFRATATEQSRISCARAWTSRRGRPPSRGRGRRSPALLAIPRT